MFLLCDCFIPFANNLFVDTASGGERRGDGVASQNDDFDRGCYREARIPLRQGLEKCRQKQRHRPEEGCGKVLLGMQPAATAA